MTILIDPASGWMYGFPKPYTKKPEQSLKDWLIENGYPAKYAEEIENNKLWCRVISTEPEFTEEELKVLRED